MKKILIIASAVMAVFLFGVVWVICMANSGTFELDHVSGDSGVLDGTDIELDLSSEKYAQKIDIVDGVLTHESKGTGYPQSAYEQERVFENGYTGINTDMQTLPYEFLGESAYAYNYGFGYDNGTVYDEVQTTKYLTFKVDEGRVVLNIDVYDDLGNAYFSDSLYTDLVVTFDEPRVITFQSNQTEEFKQNGQGSEYPEVYYEDIAPYYNDPNFAYHQYEEGNGHFYEYSGGEDSSGLVEIDENGVCYFAPKLSGDAEGTFEVFYGNDERRGYTENVINIEGYSIDLWTSSGNDYNTMAQMDAKGLHTHELFLVEDRIVLIYSRDEIYMAGIWDTEGNEIGHVNLGKQESEWLAGSEYALTHDAGNAVLNIWVVMREPFDFPGDEQYSAMTDDEHFEVYIKYEEYQKGKKVEWDYETGEITVIGEYETKNFYCAIDVSNGELLAQFSGDAIEQGEFAQGLGYYANGYVYQISLSYDMYNSESLLNVFDTLGNAVYAGIIRTDASEDYKGSYFRDSEYEGVFSGYYPKRALSIVSVKGE